MTRGARRGPLDAETRASHADHAALRLWLRLFTCSLMVERRIRARLRERFGTTLARFDYLAQLARSPQGLRMQRAVAPADGDRRQRHGSHARARGRGPGRAAHGRGRPARAGRAAHCRGAGARSTPWRASTSAGSSSCSPASTARRARARSIALLGRLKSDPWHAQRRAEEAAMTGRRTTRLRGYRARALRASRRRGDGKVATITLDRPERKNPLTFESYAELRDLFRGLAHASDVKAVVITGAGGNFCSGGDVHDIIGPLTGRDMRGPARVHAHDRRPRQGHAPLPAADRRGRRRRLRRRGRDDRARVRPAPRHAARAHRVPVRARRALPAATWARAPCCRA